MRAHIAFAVAFLLVAMLGSGICTAGGSAEAASNLPEGNPIVPRDAVLGHLYAVAMVHAGLVRISFPTDPVTGARAVQYGDAPGLDLSKSERSARVEPIVAKLQLLADADHSGKVSDEEAARLRRLYEFAPRFEAAAASGLNSTAAVAAACGLSVSEFREAISVYNEFVERADTVGLGGLSKITWDGRE